MSTPPHNWAGKELITLVKQQPKNDASGRVNADEWTPGPDDDALVGTTSGRAEEAVRLVWRSFMR